MKLRNQANKIAEFKVHPLLIPMVIKQILLCLSFDSLKTLRQLCRVWNEECVKIIRNQCRPQSFRPHAYAMPDKLKCIISSEHYPCHDFELSMDPNNIPSNTFESIGRWAKTLHVTIDQESFSTMNISKFSASFPQLKSLQIEGWKAGSKKDTEKCGKFIKTILEHAPACKQLTLLNRFANTAPILLEEVNSNKLHQINSLRIEGVISNRLLEILACSELRLTYLGLEFMDIVDTAINRSNMEKLLREQRLSLEVLELDFDCNLPFDFSVSFEFPRMEKLTTFLLTVDIEGVTGDCLEPQNLSFATQLSVLQKIEICASVDQIERFVLPCSTLRDLNCFGVGNIRKLGQNFPNVTKFHPTFLNWMQGHVFWQDLMELTLTFDSSDYGLDSVMLGICKFDVNRLWIENYTVSHEKLEQMYLNFGGAKRLRSLSKLKTLRFVPGPGVWKERANKMSYTDLPCILVLLEMESLKRIEFVDFQPSINKISEPIRCKMRKKFGNWWY